MKFCRKRKEIQAVGPAHERIKDLVIRGIENHWGGWRTKTGGVRWIWRTGARS